MLRESCPQEYPCELRNAMPDLCAIGSKCSTWNTIATAAVPTRFRQSYGRAKGERGARGRPGARRHKMNQPRWRPAGRGTCASKGLPSFWPTKVFNVEHFVSDSPNQGCTTGRSSNPANNAIGLARMFHLENIARIRGVLGSPGWRGGTSARKRFLDPAIGSRKEVFHVEHFSHFGPCQPAEGGDGLGLTPFLRSGRSVPRGTLLQNRIPATA